MTITIKLTDDTLVFKKSSQEEINHIKEDYSAGNGVSLDDVKIKTKGKIESGVFDVSISDKSICFILVKKN